MAVDTKLVCLAGIVLFAAGSVLPWANTDHQEALTGFSTPIFPLATALVILAAAGLNMKFRFSGGIALAAAGLAFVVMLYTFFTPANLGQRTETVTVDYGLIVSLLGSLVLCVSTVMGRGKY